MPGVDRHGAGYRVRIRFGKTGRFIKTGLELEEANRLALNLRDIRRQGRFPEHNTRAEFLMRELAESLLEAKRCKVRKKTGDRLTPLGIAWWERILKPCLIGAYADTPSRDLKRLHVQRTFHERAKDHPKTANEELGGVKACLRHGETIGATDFDRSILAIETVGYQVRQRHALSADEFDFFIPVFRADAQPVIETAGTVGMRIGEILSSDLEQFDPATATLSVPKTKCKERRDKTIDLARDEVALLKRQVNARRAPAVNALFVTDRGKSWTYSTFLHGAFYPALIEADRAWREKYNLDAEADTPFMWKLTNERGEPLRDDTGALAWGRLQIHDLRATAVTLMRDAGLTAEQTSERIGHADSGKLVEEIYDQGDSRVRSKVAQAIGKLAPHGTRRAARAHLAQDEGTRPSTSRGK